MQTRTGDSVSDAYTSSLGPGVMVGLANEVIDGVDLPAIIRESTSSVTADVMTDVRTQGERADDFVAGLVDRVLGRDQEPR